MVYPSKIILICFCVFRKSFFAHLTPSPCSENAEETHTMYPPAGKKGKVRRIKLSYSYRGALFDI